MAGFDEVYGSNQGYSTLSRDGYQPMPTLENGRCFSLLVLNLLVDVQVHSLDELVHE
jgi:hypothetical protein